MLYLDTSVLVSALTQEAASQHVQSWLDQQDATKLVISDWVSTELSAALSIKLRTGQINVEQRSDALAAFAGMKALTLKLFPIVSSDFLQAARYADAYATGLRAGDALHLAVASRHGATLVTRDRKLADAAMQLATAAHLL